MARQVVIFGGTFDPVHHGHLIAARSVAEQLECEKVVLMPSASPPHKNAPLVTPADRLEMLRLAVGDDDLFEIDETELRRQGPSYTYDTLTQLHCRYGEDVELIWLVGLDMLLELGSWHRARDVVELARIVTACRPPVRPSLRSPPDGTSPELR